MIIAKIVQWTIWVSEVTVKISKWVSKGCPQLLRSVHLTALVSGQIILQLVLRFWPREVLQKQVAQGLKAIHNG